MSSSPTGRWRDLDRVTGSVVRLAVALALGAILGGCTAAPPLSAETVATAAAVTMSAEAVATATSAAAATEESAPAPPAQESSPASVPPAPSGSVGTGPTSTVAAGPTLLPMGQGPAPSGLVVPSLGLDESLIELGIAADGTAEVPSDYSRVGWFTGGGRPGGIGPTVLLGHVDSLDGPAVFHRLTELAAGDDVSVTLADGTTADYRVVRSDQYAKADFPTFAVYGAVPEDRLVLVTCGGPFDRDALSYTDNVVVTAVRS